MTDDNLHSCSDCAVHAEISINTKLLISRNDNLACHSCDFTAAKHHQSLMSHTRQLSFTNSDIWQLNERTCFPAYPPTPSNAGKQISVNLGHWSREAGRVGPSRIYLLQCARSDQTSRLDVYMLLKHCGVTMATYRGACKAACDFGRMLRWCNERR